MFRTKPLLCRCQHPRHRRCGRPASLRLGLLRQGQGHSRTHRPSASPRRIRSLSLYPKSHVQRCHRSHRRRGVALQQRVRTRVRTPGARLLPPMVVLYEILLSLHVRIVYAYTASMPRGFTPGPFRGYGTPPNMPLCSQTPHRTVVSGDPVDEIAQPISSSEVVVDCLARPVDVVTAHGRNALRLLSMKSTTLRLTPFAAEPRGRHTELPRPPRAERLRPSDSIEHLRYARTRTAPSRNCDSVTERSPSTGTCRRGNQALQQHCAGHRVG